VKLIAAGADVVPRRVDVGHRQAAVGIAGADWAAAFVAQADPERWTLYDLRPLRPLAAAGRLGTLASSTEKVIHGYDALVVLSGSTPNEALALERR